VFQDINITAHKNLLVAGNNVLAIHGMNANTTSSDLLVLPELVVSVPDPGGPVAVPVYYTLDGSDPRLPGGTIGPAAIPYQGPITLNTSTPIAARALRNGEWSGLSSAQFTVQSPLRITEVMYHPDNQTLEELARTPGGIVFYDDDDYEFIEISNTGPVPVDLTGVRFANGIEHTLSGGTLAPGEFGVVVRNQAAFENRYGVGRRILGVYGGTVEDFGLQNNGERIVLVDAGNGAIHDFTYDDARDWPAQADGEGESLVIVNEAGNLAHWTDPLRWRASFEPGGSPGEKDRMQGDVNEDLRVDAADLAIVQLHLGVVGAVTRGDGDLDGDGAVTRGDVSLVARNFGRSFGPPAPSPSAPRAVLAVDSRSELRSRRATTPQPLAVDRVLRTPACVATCESARTTDNAEPVHDTPSARPSNTITASRARRGQRTIRPREAPF
jgi:hypothetical protein